MYNPMLLRELHKTAYRSALDYGHDYFGTEHILLALIESSDEVSTAFDSLGVTRRQVHEAVLSIGFASARFVKAEKALADMGIDLNKMREKVDSTFGEGALREDKMIASTPRMLQIEAIAPIEAERLGSSVPGPPHVMLALLRQDERTASVLKRVGVDIGDFRRALLKSMEVPAAIAARYEQERAQFESAELRHGANLAIKFDAALPAPGTLHERIGESLDSGAPLALLTPAETGAFREAALARGFLVIEASGDFETCWVVPNPVLRQAIIMSVSKVDGGWYAGIDDLRKIPHWLQDDHYPQRAPD